MPGRNATDTERSSAPTSPGPGRWLHASHPGRGTRTGPLWKAGRALQRGWQAFGPGFITGAADDDPSGIATYSQTGAQYGYALLWTAVWQLPLLYYVQEAVARIGAVRGKGLASAIRDQYGWPLAAALAALVVVADTINAGADIGAVAASAHLVMPVNAGVIIVLVTSLVLVLEVFVGYRRYANVLKVLGMFLLAYLVTVFATAEPWGEILERTFIPHVEFTTSFLFLTVGTFGTTITAYCWFWQSDQEVEEELEDHTIGIDGAVDEQRLTPFLKRVKSDTRIGAFWAEVVQWAIIVVCASVLWRHGITNITTATQAASALEPLAGAYAKDLFAIGVVGVGLMAIPIFAGVSAYAICELNGWRKGLDRKLADARAFYGVIVLSTVIAEVMNFANINMIKALVWTAVIWGFVAAPLLLAIARLNSDPNVLGSRRGTRASRIGVWITFCVMTLAAVALLASLV